MTRTTPQRSPTSTSPTASSTPTPADRRHTVDAEPTSRCSATARAGGSDDLSGRDRRRAQPRAVLERGGIRPDQPGLPMMIDMDDPDTLLRRKLVNPGFTRKRVIDTRRSIRLRHVDRPGLRARRVRLRPRHRRPAADDRDRRHARRPPRGSRRSAAVVRRPGRPLTAHHRRSGRPGDERDHGYTTYTWRSRSASRARPTTWSASSCTPRSTASASRTTRSSRVAAHPHWRRRDHPPRHHRRHGTAAAHPEQQSPGRRPWPAPRRDRGDAALDGRR